MPVPHASERTSRGGRRLCTAASQGLKQHALQADQRRTCTQTVLLPRSAPPTSLNFLALPVSVQHSHQHTVFLPADHARPPAADPVGGPSTIQGFQGPAGLGGVYQQLGHRFLHQTAETCPAGNWSAAGKPCSPAPSSWPPAAPGREPDTSLCLPVPLSACLGDPGGQAGRKADAQAWGSAPAPPLNDARDTGPFTLRVQIPRRRKKARRPVGDRVRKRI